MSNNGKIEKFVDVRSFGFIRGKVEGRKKGERVFFHVSDVKFVEDECKSIGEGDLVKYDVVVGTDKKGDTKKSATNIEITQTRHRTKKFSGKVRYKKFSNDVISPADFPNYGRLEVFPHPADCAVFFHVSGFSDGLKFIDNEEMVEFEIRFGIYKSKPQSLAVNIKKIGGSGPEKRRWTGTLTSGGKVKPVHPDQKGNIPVHTLKSGMKAGDKVFFEIGFFKENGNGKVQKKAVNLQKLPDLTKSMLERFEKFNTSSYSGDLIKNWELYYESLPVRKAGGNNLKLCNLPFWGKEEQIDAMAKVLQSETEVAQDRDLVAYLAAKSKSGKTACVLPAFLASPFHVYLYMAFSNNNNRNFRVNEAPVPISKTGSVAYKQGAEFILECVQNLLNNNIGEVKVSSQEATNLEAIKRELAKLFNTQLPNMKILIHLDEHRNMANSPQFRKGAIETLSSCPRIKCVATFTQVLEVIKGKDNSSGTCRDPCPKPILDLLKLMGAIPELDIRRLNTRDKGRQRQIATLAFRLCAKAMELMPDIHPSLQKATGTKTFLKDFQRAVQGGDIKKCFQLTNIISVDKAFDESEFALDLMNGVREEVFPPESMQNKKIHLSMIVTKDKVFGSWEELIHLKVNGVPGFEAAARHFRSFLSGTNTDLISVSPLEAAYSWSLLSLSAATSRLDICPSSASFQFPFNAQKLGCGRLFGPTSEGEMVDPTSLESGVLYRVAEQCDQSLDQLKTHQKINIAGTSRHGVPTNASHPLCDIFFKTTGEEGKTVLVMIDVAGTSGGKDALDEKKDALADWITTNNASLGSINVVAKGIVMAPSASADNINTGTDVCVVHGTAAQKLLGALVQVFQWIDFVCT